MKIRLGFVSNSSSTNFVCSVCGEESGGYDCSLMDAGMVECGREHTTCNNCVGKGLDEKTQEITSRCCDTGEEIPAAACPACRMDVLLDADELAFYRKETQTTNEQALERLKTLFGSYEELERHLRPKESK